MSNRDRPSKSWGYVNQLTHLGWWLSHPMKFMEHNHPKYGWNMLNSNWNHESAGLTGITARQSVVNCQGHEGRTGNFSALVHGSNANRYVLKMFIAIDWKSLLKGHLPKRKHGTAHCALVLLVAGYRLPKKGPQTNYQPAGDFGHCSNNLALKYIYLSLYT